MIVLHQVHLPAIHILVFLQRVTTRQISPGRLSTENQSLRDRAMRMLKDVSSIDPRNVRQPCEAANRTQVLAAGSCCGFNCAAKLFSNSRRPRPPYRTEVSNILAGAQCEALHTDSLTLGRC